MFRLDERLARDTVPVLDLPLCSVLLNRIKSFPWIILVPRRENMAEWIDLSAADQQALLAELSLASRVLRTVYHPDKLNTGALGNMVKQLHIHVIARYRVDSAWPSSVWGHPDVDYYTEEEAHLAAERLSNAFRELMDDQIPLFFPASGGGEG